MEGDRATTAIWDPFEEQTPTQEMADFFFLAGAVRARGSDGHKRCGLVQNKTAKQSKKGNTIKCSKQGFAQIAQASLLTTQGCTFLKQNNELEE